MWLVVRNKINLCKLLCTNWNTNANRRWIKEYNGLEQKWLQNTSTDVKISLVCIKQRMRYDRNGSKGSPFHNIVKDVDEKLWEPKKQVFWKEGRKNENEEKQGAWNVSNERATITDDLKASRRLANDQRWRRRKNDWRPDECVCVCMCEEEGGEGVWRCLWRRIEKEEGEWENRKGPNQLGWYDETRTCSLQTNLHGTGSKSMRRCIAVERKMRVPPMHVRTNYKTIKVISLTLV